MTILKSFAKGSLENDLIQKINF